MELESVLVTGATRGIGLEFVKQLVKLPKTPRFIFATFRDENAVEELEKIKESSKETEIILIKMDIRNAEDIERAQKLIEEKVGDMGLNLLINNAGALRHQSFTELTEENMLFHFRTNTVAPVMVLKKMLSLLQKASSRKRGGMSVSRAAVLNISGLFGSISELPKFIPEKVLPVLSYRTSKTLKQLRDESKKTIILLIKMDARNADQIDSARRIIEDMVGEKGLNLLINNAGVLAQQGFPEITEDNMLLQFETNTIGPVMIFKAMLPLLQKAATSGPTGMNVSKAAVLNISSLGGSIKYQSGGSLDCISYKTSKTALNMAMKVISMTIKDQGILVVNMCPGWVKTDLGSAAAQLEVSESVSAIMNTLSRLDESHHGTFIDRNGETIPY